MFAWDSYEHGSDIHPLADPTKLELMHSEFKKKKEDFKGDQQQSILEKYGGEEHLDAPPKALLLAQTVNTLTLCSIKCVYQSNVLKYRKSMWSILVLVMSYKAKRRQ